MNSPYGAGGREERSPQADGGAQTRTELDDYAFVFGESDAQRLLLRAQKLSGATELTAADLDEAAEGLAQMDARKQEREHRRTANNVFTAEPKPIPDAEPEEWV